MELHCDDCQWRSALDVQLYNTSVMRFRRMNQERPLALEGRARRNEPTGPQLHLVFQALIRSATLHRFVLPRKMASAC